MLSHDLPSRRAHPQRGHSASGLVGRGVDTAFMSHFLGTHTNRIDAKGRVSIPAPFRAAVRALAVEGVPSLVLRPSQLFACVEGWPAQFFAALAAPLSQYDILGEDHEDLSSALYADANPVESDKEGRIVLPDPLMEYAGLTDTVVFMGLGRTFQIWEPAAAERRRVEARDRSRMKRLALPGSGVVQPPVTLVAPGVPA